jgi:hypothetical protein
VREGSFLFREACGCRAAVAAVPRTLLSLNCIARSTVRRSDGGSEFRATLRAARLARLRVGRISDVRYSQRVIERNNYASSPSHPLALCIPNSAFDHGESVRPRLEDVARPQSEHVPPKPFDVDIAVPIVCESVLTLMPFPSVNVEAEAFVDEKILAAHSGYVRLSLDAVSRPL